MKLRFSLNKNQLKSIQEEGIYPEICGPVDGTTDMMHLEVEHTHFHKVIVVFHLWGKRIGEKIGNASKQITGKLRTMYPLTRKSAM
ncbi:MAG: hypothetical protein WKF88_05570 [Ferruginibacter sp.]